MSIVTWTIITAANGQPIRTVSGMPGFDHRANLEAVAAWADLDPKFITVEDADNGDDRFVRVDTGEALATLTRVPKGIDYKP